jgi:ABC-type dipeptide/oligopeptide/nickel transport system permease component
LKKSIPVTIELAAMAIVLGVALAIPLGVLSATRQDKLRITWAACWLSLPILP